MPDPKRCEVCGLPPCNLWMTGCEGHCHCNGHPRPDDSEKVRSNYMETACSKCGKFACHDWSSDSFPNLTCGHEKNFCHCSPTPKEVPPRTEEWENIMKQEGLTGWKLRIKQGSDGICFHTSKEIIVGATFGFYGFLHELAHALVPPDDSDKTGHTATWGDTFTRLCAKYPDAQALLSYGKERERKMWRKCMEAVRCHDISAYVGSEVVDLHNDILSDLDALNPDKSSPDEGREG